MNVLENDEWKPSIDLKKVRSLLKSEDPMLLVIRGHLILENVLISFIQSGLIKESSLKIDRLNFPAKAELATAMGILPENLFGLLLYVNKLRNGFAHNLEYQIGSAEIKIFSKMLPPEARELLLQDKNDTKRSIPLEEVPLSKFFEIMFVMLDLSRHQYSEWQRNKKEAEKKLQAALANLEKVEKETSIE